MSKSSLFVLVVVLLAVSARYLYMKPKFSSGEAVPDFNLEMKDGANIQLSSLKGKYVLLDFWGSWCGPCLDEMPKLSALYQKYNNKQYKNADDFEIIAIAVEKDKARWESAIQKFQLNWKYHYCDFNFFDTPIIKHYGVREIPSKYLLDQNGEILSVNASTEELDQFLENQLK